MGFDEMIGQIDVLDRKKAINHWKAKGLDFSNLFFDPNMGDGVPKFRCEKQQHPIENIQDTQLIELSKNALLNKKSVGNKKNRRKKKKVDDGKKKKEIQKKPKI